MLISAFEKGEQPEKAPLLFEEMQRRGRDPETVISRGCCLSSSPRNMLVTMQRPFFLFEGVLTCPWPEVMGYKWR